MREQARAALDGHQPRARGAVSRMLMQGFQRLSGPLVGGGVRMAGAIAVIGLKGAGMAGWRLAAGACGVVFAGWLASGVVATMDATADPARETQASPGAAPASSPTVTGALRNAAIAGERPEWVVVARQPASFALGGPEHEGQPVRFAARRDLHSPLREDQMRAGSFEGEAPMLSIGFQRQAPEQLPPFFVDLSRNLSDLGLSAVRTAQPTALATKFGPIEAADVMLSDGRRERPCIAFRHAADATPFRIHGVICGGPKRPADRQQLTCLLDRATLVSAGDDRELRAHFTAAELKRHPGCHVPKHQTAGRRANWLDPDQAAPKLRRSGG